MTVSITFNYRPLKVLFLVVICIGIPAYYVYHVFKPPYEFYRTIGEEELKQSKHFAHNERQSKYVRFKQLQGAGFNNQAQEILLFHHLALSTGRIYVYQPLIWRPRGEKATVPLSTFLRGPTERTISDAMFDEVCPPDEVVHVNLVYDYRKQWDHAKEVLSRDDRCVVVDDWIFSWNYLASTGIHAIWPSFQQYLRVHFKWSDKVLEIVERAQNKLGLRSSQDTNSNIGNDYIALHLRRGDFEDHCHILAERGTGFTTWATLPFLEASTFPPALDTSNTTSVIEHCYPSLRRILDAVTFQAKRNPHVRALHVLHDGAWDHPTVYLQYYKLITALTNAKWAEEQGWPNGPILHVTQSADVPLEWGERDWTVCVDVELARRAQVFIGNGYSSLSTQIVALRLGSDAGKVEDITFI
ncbi:hypothetical protein CVT24_009663 [Panaeolus cyanescens]|uniref:Uncharacterized protein n=1 Tax=Panaeolus cyanescens TaxID=181874 RepID=A0A409Y9L7_9AGAR|nr:hypothetical protein CVT24_009663 [Panaeolus cyanescens]